MEDLICQLGNVLFQEYEWSQTMNCSQDTKESILYISKLTVRHCMLKNTQDNFLPWKQVDTLWYNPFEESISLLDTCLLQTIQPKTIIEKHPSSCSDKAPVFCTKASQIILDWIGIPCLESNPMKWEIWLEDILEETFEAHQLFVQHLYTCWKMQYYEQHCRKRPYSLFKLQVISSKLVEKEKIVSLQTFSKWKNDIKQPKNSNENVFNAIQYDDPLDDFLDMASNEAQNKIRQKYHPEEETKDTVHTISEPKRDSICHVHIPKKTCISATFMSLTQRLMGCKSFLLLPPPLEIFLVGVVMVYHYLIATDTGQRCLWIAQDEYSFVAALLKSFIGPQLVLDLSSDKSCCYLCHVDHLSHISRDEEFSLVVYTVQSFNCCNKQIDSVNQNMYWELCSPFIETCDACLVDPLSTHILNIDLHPIVSMLNHSSSDMLILSLQDTQLGNLLEHLRQTWITFQPSGYQIEGLKVIEDHATTFIQQLQVGCHLSIPDNIGLVDLSAASIENTLYKARHYIQQHFQTLQASKPRKNTDNDWHCSYATTTSTHTFLSDIQQLIALHTLRTAYDYTLHDGLFAASKYLETAQKRYGAMLPCMRSLQDILEDLGQVDKLVHPKTDFIIQICKQLKQTYEQQRKCLPNFRNVPFRILIITLTRYTTHILKRDLNNRGVKSVKSGIDIVERKTLQGQQDIRRYYAILDISMLEWKPVNCISFHETLSHWPSWIATQLYEWIMSQVIEYRCIVLDRNHYIQDSHLKWSTYDHLYQRILSSLVCKKTCNEEEDCRPCGIYVMAIRTVEMSQGWNILLSHLMEMYHQLSIIFLCCLSNQPQNDRKHMIHISTIIQLHPPFRRIFYVKFFFHHQDYERWLNNLTLRNKKYQILRDWMSARPPTSHFHLSFSQSDHQDKQTKLQWTTHGM
ncbi:hypothetical protein GpartN1_g7081.t1 [Galdieria partita]|uniref:Uncharacterized protein n=1 Tax=Galdieria partita TaxID=83374 RepID=A0A9C7Q3A5_9RHOD|nr:hypothetical protein GpartN1_g7081.t1 [Galdieria partita]